MSVRSLENIMSQSSFCHQCTFHCRVRSCARRDCLATDISSSTANNIRSAKGSDVTHLISLKIGSEKAGELAEAVPMDEGAIAFVVLERHRTLA